MKTNYYLPTLFIAFFLFISNFTNAQSIYGTTPSGGYINRGVMFKYTPTPNTETVVNFGIPYNGPAKSAIITAAEKPVGSLLFTSNGIIYGVSAWGGGNGSGTIYGYNPLMDTIGVVHSFNWSDGSEPVGGLVQGVNGIFYGLTEMGGLDYAGVIFSFDPTTGVYTKLEDFNSTKGSGPAAKLTGVTGNLLFGTTNSGGTNQKGTLFSYNLTTSTFTKALNFSTTTGYSIYGALNEHSNGNLYGFARSGGSQGFGTLFEFNPNTEVFSVLHNFDSTNGSFPQGGPFILNGNIYGVAANGGANNQGVLFKFDIAAGTFTKMLDFDSALTGSFPMGTLSLGSDGWLYGSTYEGGAFNFGVLFKFDLTTNTLVKLLDFDGVNGKKPEYIQFVETSSLAFSVNDSVFTAPPFDVQFTNKTSNPTHYVWKWQFGDGAISYQKNPAHTYTSNGTYSVTLIGHDTINNTYDTLLRSNFIQLNGAAACPVTANIAPSGHIAICPGDSVLLHASNPNSSYSYQWLRTGLYLEGATDTVFWAKQSGYYQVRVDNGSCWTFSNVAFVNPFPTQTPRIKQIGWIAPCSNDSLKLKINGTYGSYQWSTGATSSSIYVKISGLYHVDVVDNNGCTVRSQVDTINTSIIAAPHICIVGVDSTSGKNIIVWNQSSDLKMDSIRVYKETSVQNVFQKIGQKARSEVGMLIDQNSDPRITSYRYYLMGVDSCGKVTPIGTFHRTIHLQVNIGAGNSWNLNWNKYEGANLGTYHIYRGTDSTQMSLLANLPANLHSYTDYTPPSGNVYYLLKVDLASACNPGGSTNYSLSSSNFFNTKDATVGIDKIELHNISLSVFPNPNNGLFNIKIESANQQNISLMIFNNMGSLVATEQFTVNGSISKRLSLEHLSKGIYYLRIQTKDDVVMRKVIIQ